MRKQKIKILLLFLSCLICVGEIKAHFKDTDKKINTIGIHNNTVVIKEEYEKPEPGIKTIKSPKVENTGSVDCYVRAKILLSDSRGDSYIEYYHDEKKGWNTDEWKQKSDGWFYYEKNLESGKISTPIFDHILLKEEVPDEIKDLSIDVIFESVQAKGFSSSMLAFKTIR